MDRVVYAPREFTPLGRPDRYEWMERGACFRNAFTLATSSSSLRYGEGYALTAPGLAGGVWVHHAWVIDPDGNAIDATWRATGLRYVGIAIGADELRTRQLAKRRARLVEPVLATMLSLTADLEEVTWDLAGWFIGVYGQARGAGPSVEAG